MGTAKRAVAALSWVVLVGFVLTLALGFFVPLYTDEVGAKLQLSRIFAEGGHVVSLLPQCTSSFRLPVPTTFYPGMALYAVLFSGVGLMGLKISGIVLAVIWFAVAALVIRRTTRDAVVWRRRLALFVAVHAIGVVPFTLVLARSEGTLVLAIGAYIAFPFVWTLESRQTIRGRLLVTLGFLLLTSVFYASHPKTLLFTPLVLLSAALTFASRRHFAWGLVVLPLVVWTTQQTHRQAKAYTTCEAPTVARVFTWITLDTRLAWTDPPRFLREGGKNLAKHVDDVADSMVLQAVPASNWLPSVPLTSAVRLLNGLSSVVLYGVQIVTPMLLFASVHFARDRRVRKTVAFAATLFGCLFVHVFLASHWNFYMSGFVVALLAIVAALSMHALSVALPPLVRRRAGLLLRLASVVVFVLASVSMAGTLVYLGPRLVALSGTEGTFLPTQPASSPIFGMTAAHVKIREHARRCGITGDGATHLVVDDVTIFAFERLREPVNIIYVTDAAMWGLDFPGDKDVAFLRDDLKSPGIITRCAWLPTALVTKVRSEDGYCCVGAEDFR